MTSLPVTIPKGFSLVVKKGDSVKAGDLLAGRDALDESSVSPESPPLEQGEEQSINLARAFSVNPTSTRKYLKKAPGDSVSVGEVVAARGKSLGLKQEEVVASVSGTVIRFERDTGRLIVRTNTPVSFAQPVKIATPSTIVSPLAGTISVCNNDAIVIESESKTLVGSAGSGGAAKGELLVLSPLEGKDRVTSEQITKECSGKILLLPSIDREAVSKACAIDVAGILGTEVPKEVFEYLSLRKMDLPVIEIDLATGKKLMKSQKEIIIHGIEKVIVPQD